MISIQDYVGFYQPEVLAFLEFWQGAVQVVAARERHGFEWWKRLMETPPGFEKRREMA